jgi:hypothetical protein
MGSALPADNTSRKPAPTPSRAIFVVGAGRSGTSAITRALLALGVHLGDNLKAPTEKNPTGFFEDRDLLGIAKRVRSRLDLRAESVSLIEPEQWSLQALEPLVEEAAQSISQRFVRYPIWGFKYAQTLRMLPFWEQVAERARIALSFVVAARNPLSVAHSRAKLDPLRGLQEKTDIEWLVNVVPYFQRLGQYPFVVVDYDLLMAEPRQQLERLGRKLTIPLDDRARQSTAEYVSSFLRPGMRHTRFSEADLDREPRLNPLTRDAYRWLWRLANDLVDPRDPELWNDWARIEGQLRAMAPVLRHVDYLEAEVRRLRRGTWSRAVAKLFGGRGGKTD